MLSVVLVFALFGSGNSLAQALLLDFLACGGACRHTAPLPGVSSHCAALAASARLCHFARAFGCQVEIWGVRFREGC